MSRFVRAIGVLAAWFVGLCMIILMTMRYVAGKQPEPHWPIVLWCTMLWVKMDNVQTAVENNK